MQHYDLSLCKKDKTTGRFLKGPRTHGLSRTRVYNIWESMLVRCSDRARGHSRDRYFLRGIKVCERWKRFENFFADMGLPLPNQSIDRIDNDGHYEPGNCRWATASEQASNSSRNVWLTVNGERKTISQWAEIAGIKRNTIQFRLLRGWSHSDAVLKPVNHNMWAKRR